MNIQEKIANRIKHCKEDVRKAFLEARQCNSLLKLGLTVESIFAHTNYSHVKLSGKVSDILSIVSALEPAGESSLAIGHSTNFPYVVDSDYSCIPVFEYRTKEYRFFLPIPLEQLTSIETKTRHVGHSAINFTAFQRRIKLIDGKLQKLNMSNGSVEKYNSSETFSRYYVSNKEEEKFLLEFLSNKVAVEDEYKRGYTIQN